MTPIEDAAYAYLAALPLIGSPAATITVRQRELKNTVVEAGSPALIFTVVNDDEICHDGKSGRALAELKMTIVSVRVDEANEVRRNLSDAIAGVRQFWGDRMVQCRSFRSMEPMAQRLPMEPQIGETFYELPVIADLSVSPAI